MFKHLGLLIGAGFLFAVTVAAPIKAFAATKAKEDQTEKAEPKKIEKKRGEPEKAEKQKLIDINSASENELRSLPGISDADAKKIVANRPYKRKNQLVSKKIIPKEEYEKIKDQIIAKQNK